MMRRGITLKLGKIWVILFIVLIWFSPGCNRENPTITPDVSADSVVIYDINFMRHRFFLIDEADSIVSLEVYRDDRNENNDSATGALPETAYFYWSGDTGPDMDLTDLSYPGKFNRLQRNEDYLFYEGLRVIELTDALDEEEILSVFYTTGTGKSVGDTNQHILKLLRPEYAIFPNEPQTLLSPQNTLDSAIKVLWEYELKNIYYLGGTEISDVAINIFKETGAIDSAGENGKTYLQILGLDNNNDGKIDETVTYNGILYQILYRDRGYLAFPLDPYPFANSELNVPDSIYWYKDFDVWQIRGNYYIVARFKQL